MQMMYYYLLENIFPLSSYILSQVPFDSFYLRSLEGARGCEHISTILQKGCFEDFFSEGGTWWEKCGNFGWQVQGFQK